MIAWLDGRFEDWAALREGLLHQFLTASHQNIERVEHDVRVTPRTIRSKEGSTMKGYLRESFKEAWSRYLPALFSNDADAVTP